MIRWVLFLVVALLGGFFLYVEMNNDRPANLGVTDGKFAPCPESPNCISTQASSSDKLHYAAPVVYTGAVKDAQLTLEKYFIDQGDARFIKSELGYLYIETRSAVFGYIDDVEVYWPDNEKVFHVRSASRVGYSDMDVNRKRIEQIRSLFVNL